MKKITYTALALYAFLASVVIVYIYFQNPDIKTQQAEPVEKNKVITSTIETLSGKVKAKNLNDILIENEGSQLRIDTNKINKPTIIESTQSTASTLISDEGSIPTSFTEVINSLEVGDSVLIERVKKTGSDDYSIVSVYKL